MYDHLTTRYTFACPEHGDARVALSSFRRLERLPGAAHPAVFGVRFECGCGGEHSGLVTHEELDWLPLGLGTGVSFLNLMTDRLEALEVELAQLSARRVGGGARRAGGQEGGGGGVAVEFLLLPGDPPPPGLPVLFFPVGAVCGARD